MSCTMQNHALVRSAARTGGSVALNALLQAEPFSQEVNRLGPLGSNALHLAVWRNHEGLVQVLLAAKADPNATDAESGWTALHRALYWGNLRIAAALLAADASLFRPEDWKGRSPLDLLSHELRELLPSKGPGEVFAWGSDATYALGIGSTSAGERAVQPIPTRVDTLHRARVLSLAASKFHSAAVDESGRLWTWGWGLGGRLGHPEAHIHSGESAVIAPCIVSGLGKRKVVAIAAAKHHTLLCTSAGETFTFGSNKHAQLGYGGADTQPEPRRVAALRARIVAVAAANKHSVAVAAGGEVYTWGSNALGQLGYGTFDSACSPTPRLVEALKNRHAIAASAAKRHTLVLTADGEVLTFGHRGVSPRRVVLAGARDVLTTNGRALAFHRGHADVAKPVVAAIAAGAAHSSALTSTGVVMTWRSADPALQVQEIAGALAGKRVVSVSAGKYRTAVVTDEGDVYAWEGRSDFFPAEGRTSGSGSKKGAQRASKLSSRGRPVPIPPASSAKSASFGTNDNVLRGHHASSGTPRQQQRVNGTSPGVVEGSSPINSYGSSVKSSRGAGGGGGASFLERVYVDRREGGSMLAPGNLMTGQTESPETPACGAAPSSVDAFEAIVPKRVAGLKRAGLVAVGEKHTLALQRWSAVQLESLSALPWLTPARTASVSRTDDDEEDTSDDDDDAAAEHAISMSRGGPITAENGGFGAYGPSTLQSLCEEAVARQLVDPRTALQVLEYADVAGASILKSYCITVAVCNLDAVLLEARGAFEELPGHLLAELEDAYKARLRGAPALAREQEAQDATAMPAMLNADVHLADTPPTEGAGLDSRSSADRGLLASSADSTAPGRVLQRGRRPTAAASSLGDSMSNQESARLDRSSLQTAEVSIGLPRLHSESSFKDLAAAQAEDATHRLRRTLGKKLQQIDHLVAKESQGERLDLQQRAKVSQRPVMLSALAALDAGMPPEDVQSILQAASAAMTAHEGQIVATEQHVVAGPSGTGLSSTPKQSTSKIDQPGVSKSFAKQHLKHGVVGDGGASSRNRSRNRRRLHSEKTVLAVESSAATMDGTSPPLGSFTADAAEAIDEASVAATAEVKDRAAQNSDDFEFGTAFPSLAAATTKAEAKSAPLFGRSGSHRPRTHVVGFAATAAALTSPCDQSTTQFRSQAASLDQVDASQPSDKPRKGGLSMFLRGDLDRPGTPGLQPSPAPAWGGRAPIGSAPSAASLKDIQIQEQKRQKEGPFPSGAATKCEASSSLRQQQAPQRPAAGPPSSASRMSLGAFLNVNASSSGDRSPAWGIAPATIAGASPPHASLKDIQAEQERRRQTLWGASPPTVAARPSWGEHVGHAALGSSPGAGSSMVLGTSPSGRVFLASPGPAQSKWYVPEDEELEQRRAKSLRAIQAEENAMRELARRYGKANVKLVKPTATRKAK